VFGLILFLLVHSLPSDKGVSQLCGHHPGFQDVLMEGSSEEIDREG